MRGSVPVTPTTAILLGLLGINALMAALGKVARQMLAGSGSAVGQAGMVTVVELVAASHCRPRPVSKVFFDNPSKEL